MLRLLLVFLSVVLFALEISPSIMALFVAVVTGDHKKIFLKAFRPCVIGDCITSSNGSTKAGVSLLVFFFLKSLCGLFSSLLAGLRIAKGIICRLELLDLIRLFDSGSFIVVPLVCVLAAVT